MNLKRFVSRLCNNRYDSPSLTRQQQLLLFACSLKKKQRFPNQTERTGEVFADVVKGRLSIDDGAIEELEANGLVCFADQHRRVAISDSGERWCGLSEKEHDVLVKAYVSQMGKNGSSLSVHGEPTRPLSTVSPETTRIERSVFVSLCKKQLMVEQSPNQFALTNDGSLVMQMAE